MATSTITPHRIAVPDPALDDLRERLARTRWPDEQEGVGRAQGLPLGVTRDLAAAWTAFDWRAREAQLNTLAQYETEIDGAHLCFVHERADDPDAPALLLLHGWPSTIADYAGLVAPLRERFHVVVPALPGFPLSGPGYMAQHSGYAIEQAQRPLTLGYGLTDSPVGQLAWIGEKLHDWADAATPVPLDALLTTVSLYWFTASATGAARVYWEGARDGSWLQAPEVSTTPTAVAVFPNGLAGGLPVRSLAERVNPIVRWTEFDRGSHFPALEVPDLLLEDLTATFTPA